MRTGVGTVELNMKNIQATEDMIMDGLIEAAETIFYDLRKYAKTMPYDTGTMQRESTFIDSSKVRQGIVDIVTDTPYARRLYFHPEYKFNQEHNPNAGGGWFEPYISGGKKDMAQERFESYIKSRVGG